MMVDGPATLRLARDHLAKGLVLGQKLAGRGAVEVTGEGAEVTLSDGRVVLDFASYAVTLFGHRNPHVVTAVRAELDRLPTSTRSLCNPVTTAAAARLVSTFPDSGLVRVWFGLNGSDVVDAALKLARLRTGRSTIAAVVGGFHGKSLGALAATWSPRYREGLETVLAPAVHLEPRAEALAEAAAHHDLAAVIVEPIQGEGGVRELPLPVLAQWRNDARAAGIVFIADEIQVGLGRCGPPSIAVKAGLRPDALLLGKPLGGGVMPMSALLATDDLWGPLAADPFRHTATFSGHPLGCAAVLAALDLVPDAQQRAGELDEQLSGGLRRLVFDHPTLLHEVRGRGLLWGLIARTPEAAGHLLTTVQQDGLLISPCLGDPQVLRLLPPSVTTDAQLDRALTILDGACRSTTAMLTAGEGDHG